MPVPAPNQLLPEVAPANAIPDLLSLMCRIDAASPIHDQSWPGLRDDIVNLLVEVHPKKASKQEVFFSLGLKVCQHQYAFNTNNNNPVTPHDIASAMAQSGLCILSSISAYRTGQSAAAVSWATVEMIAV